MQRIVCAAIRKNNVVICGARHFDQVMRDMIAHLQYDVNWKAAEQGFIDNKGKFITREEAYIVAKEANQIIREVGGNNLGQLFSENLY